MPYSSEHKHADVRHVHGCVRKGAGGREGAGGRRRCGGEDDDDGACVVKQGDEWPFAASVRTPTSVAWAAF